ncbi:MAG: hypothetical protein P3W91_005065 [Fervidobacterium sp.]|nr:hypothetical protein [Fervidobacterium sp.]
MFTTATFNYDRAMADESYYGFTNTLCQVWEDEQEEDDEDKE